MKTISYKITDPLGVHARPAGLLVREASGFKSAITLKKGEKSADAKKIFGVMGMAVKTGEDIELVIEGEDEDVAAEKLEAFLKSTL